MSGRQDGAIGGAAQELPAGRLRSFEDDDAGPDLASLLSRRAPRDNADRGTGETADTLARAATGGGSAQLATGTPAPTAKAATKATKSRTTAATAGAQARAPRQRAKTSPVQPAAVPSAVPEHQNRIRSSTVQIPAALLDRVIAERGRSDRSNGEIIIAAIEQTHSELPVLIGRRDSTGGGLFAARASRGARLSDGPLTPLNVRLYEADYRVIDQLVTQFGAYSRGHLVSTALTAYFDTHPAPQ